MEKLDNAANAALTGLLRSTRRPMSTEQVLALARFAYSIAEAIQEAALEPVIMQNQSNSNWSAAAIFQQKPSS